MEVNHTVRDNEMAELEIIPQVNVSLGKVQPDIDKNYDATLVHPATTLTILKLEEAAYFLAQARATQRHQAACLYNCNAFLGAMKSVPQILERELVNNSDARTWLAVTKKRLYVSPVERLAKMRDHATHNGAPPPRVSVICDFREDLTGQPSISFEIQAEDFHGKPLPKPFAGFQEQLDIMRQVVDEAHQRGFVKSRLGNIHHGFGFKFHKEQPDGSWKAVPPSEIHVLSKLEMLAFGMEQQ